MLGPHRPREKKPAAPIQTSRAERQCPFSRVFSIVCCIATMKGVDYVRSLSRRHCRERKRRSNPDRCHGDIAGLLRFARGDDTQPAAAVGAALSRWRFMTILLSAPR